MWGWLCVYNDYLCTLYILYYIRKTSPHIPRKEISITCAVSFAHILASFFVCVVATNMFTLTAHFGR